MQAQGYIQSVGDEVESFWKESNGLAEENDIARKIASESLVLLKNEGNVLPLAKKGTIAVVGPLADSRSYMPGTWRVAALLKNATSLAEGLKAVAGGKAEILTAKGCNLMRCV